MKRIIIILGLVCSCGTLWAQMKVQDELVAVTNVSHHTGISVVEFVDPYLSLLNYAGYGLRVEYTDSRYFNPANPKFSSYSRVSGLAVAAGNPSATAGAIYVGGNVAWGAMYEYRDFDNWVILAGANVDFDFGYKMNSRNVNNPFNMDLATNLNAMLGVRYLYATMKRNLRFKAHFEFPLIGCMFVPYPGLGYYELYTSGAYGEAIHFSSLHNKQGLKEQISIDIPLRFSTWTFGARMHQLKYQAGDQPYSFNEFSVFVGINYDIVRFAGRIKKRPDHYISPGN